VPLVFSPGEPETRPLYPDGIVYTTAQKVADLLEISAQDAILMSADADNDGVSGVSQHIYITGNEYRDVGFSVGDKVRVYSDADPLGFDDMEITVIGKGTGDKSGHVKLTIYKQAELLTLADYQVADNGYIQNHASFTNGRTRGLTKDKVDNIILKMQDRIDNMTRNAWRPYLVSAEYINFDTYKPYRRRYYTDYVGTSPLLFRNVQQVLRLELWQGDDYREIAAAEARIKFNDISNLASSRIYVSPGNGSVATLAQGTGTNQWRDDFEATTVAQNLADLINKEDRVGKTVAEFAPAFTLEKGTSSTTNISVHHEFFASANSDYGTGVVKVTSMRPVKAGEVCSIVTSSSDIDIDQTQTNSTTFSSLDSTTINVASTTGFVNAGVAIDASGDVFRYTGKTATSFTGCVAVTGSLGAITGAITQQSFLVDLQGGSGSGDVGRLRDWWIDYEMGIIYFNNSYPFFEWNAIKTAYIYGERYVEKAIEDVCTKMVAIELLMSDDRSVLIPEGTQNIDLASKVQLYQAEIDRTLPKYVEMVVFE